METFNNFLGGTAALFGDPVGVFIFFGGVIGGMLFGAIPGVSMLTLAAILLPFTAHLSAEHGICLLYTSPSPRDRTRSRMPSSA